MVVNLTNYKSFFTLFSHNVGFITFYQNYANFNLLKNFFKAFKNLHIVNFIFLYYLIIFTTILLQ